MHIGSGLNTVDWSLYEFSYSDTFSGDGNAGTDDKYYRTGSKTK